MRDYEVLRREFPDDNEVAESLFHAQVALKKSRGEEVYLSSSKLQYLCQVSFPPAFSTKQ